MVLNEVIWHNRNAYRIIRRIKEHNVSPKGILNKEMLEEWKKYVGADIVLRQNAEFCLCEIIPEAEIIEDEVQILVEEAVIPLVEEAIIPTEEESVILKEENV